MTVLLHIDASARVARSISRSLSGAFVDAWRRHDPGVEVLRRDVGGAPPPFVSEAWIAAAFTPEDERTEAQRRELAASDRLIDELARADVIAIGAPMYNYGMPAALKAWVDQVVRVNRTFSFDLARGDFPLRPILGGKTLALFTSSGEFGFEPGGVRASMDHLAAHVETVRGYLGAERMHHIAAEYQEFGDDRHRASVAHAMRQAAALADALARDSARPAPASA